MGELRNADGLRPPAKLGAHHELASFDSGEPALDDWLRKRALSNAERGGAQTYVISVENRVVAYYTLSAGAVDQAKATGRARRNMPSPIPVMLIGRLAVERSHQGRGLGRALLRDAILRTLQAAEIAGIRAILVHALSEKAQGFYEQGGFQSSPTDPMMLMITVPDAKESLGLDGDG